MMIEKLTIKIGEKKIELTPEEAKQLHSELAELFAKPDYVPFHVQPQPYFPNPIWVTPNTATPPWKPLWEITC